MKNKLQQVREKLGFKGFQMAEKLGIAPSFYSEIEKGKKELSRKIIYSLYEKFNVSPLWIIGDTGKMFLDVTNVTSRNEELLFKTPIRKVEEGEIFLGVTNVTPRKEDATNVAPSKKQNIDHQESYLLEKSNAFSKQDEISPQLKPLKIIDPNNLPPNSYLIPMLNQSLAAGYGSDLEDDEVTGMLPVPSYLRGYQDLRGLAVDGDSMEPSLRRGDIVVCDSGGWQGEGIYALQMNGSGFVKRLSQRPGKIVVMSDNPAYEAWEVPLEDEGLRVVGRARAVVKKLE